MKKVAVILSGCGVFDGAEIHEAVISLLALARQGAAVQCFAPNVAQLHVINHLTGEVSEGESRNVLVEAARICRGQIKDVAELDAADYDALLVPGGFGAAKNLCDFAIKGSDCEVIPDVVRVIKDFHKSKKPIALCCIAPVLAARVLGTRMNGPGCRVTIGTDAQTANAIATMGSENIAKAVRDVCVDEPNRLITTPAYMYDATAFEVFEGIGKMIDTLTAMLNRA